MNIAATDRLSLDFMASSLDFQYTRLTPSVAHSSVVPGGTGQMTLDMKQPYTPELTWSAGIQYEFPLSGGGSLTARVDSAFQDEVYTQAVNYAQAQPVNDRKTAWIDDYTLSHCALHVALGRRRLGDGARRGEPHGRGLLPEHHGRRVHVGRLPGRSDRPAADVDVGLPEELRALSPRSSKPSTRRHDHTVVPLFLGRSGSGTTATLTGARAPPARFRVRPASRLRARLAALHAAHAADESKHGPRSDRSPVPTA